MSTEQPAYRSHAVLAALDRYTEFYEQLSKSIMGFVTRGTGMIGNVDTYMYQSIGGTLDSIRVVLRSGADQ